jgi:hypothetical protein
MAEEKVYSPSPEFVRRAHVQGMEGYKALYGKAAETPEQFWGERCDHGRRRMAPREGGPAQGRRGRGSGGNARP